MYEANFRETANALRKLIRDAHLAVRQGIWRDAKGVEQHLVGEAFLHLYDHLTYHEQWSAAAHLVGHCVPTALATDIRLVAVLESAATLTARLEDPEKALVLYRQNVHSIDDAFAKNASLQSHRGLYWVRATRLFNRGQRDCRALEFGTGCGSNVLHAAGSIREIQWFGTDESRPQVDANRAQAVRLSIPATFSYIEDLEPDSFDSVAVMDVLEHTVYPHEVLDKAEALVKKGGILTVTAPHGPWSLGTNNVAGVGDHVNVTTLGGLCAMIAHRNGGILAADVVQGPSPCEYNSSACVTYIVNRDR